ncbi:FAD-dependent monooxygenase [Nocardioides zeae]|uniref:FAD-dependent monooxygenase n=1 Tax=Nocardioides imazamoxiresistens TaxID=3231893 RepID=A0ABU3PZH3_9ACTN|nr:FAD-dependent monooxygenase [Nocardioides zeae]MDT9594261.1 FAD-dependent monooxygenase [Nocardioides zeae]
MGSTRRVLVTGASIAGPAAAFWLARAGFEVTVVERAPELREGGQNIDVRATGREVLRRMGLEQAVLDRNTGEVGTRFVDEDGSVLAEFDVDGSEDSDGPTAELEILRGALARVVADACPETVRWRFGAQVVEVHDVADADRGVEVVLDDGSRETYDVLVVAEGVGSRTRALVLGEEPQEDPLGMYAVYGTIPRTDADDDWWRILHAPDSRQAALRPDDVGTIRANLNFLADGPVLADLDHAGRLAAIRERYAGVGWEVPRILDGFDAADDLYVDWLRQVRCPTWHRGSTVLLGDAAWSLTPLGGGGASLALVGAYVLAAHLADVEEPTRDALARAFERYEEWMRPLVEDAQDLPPGVPRLAAPRTRAGVQVLRWGVRVAASSPVRALAQRVTRGPQAERELPTLEV